MSKHVNTKYELTTFTRQVVPGAYASLGETYALGLTRDGGHPANPRLRVEVHGVATEYTGTKAVYIESDDLARALEDELGWTIITEPLPVVAEGKTGYLFAGGYICNASRTAEDFRSSALANLAAAKFLQDNPPVDAEQVEALAKVLADDRADDMGTSWQHYTDEARRLVQAGVRAPENKEADK